MLEKPALIPVMLPVLPMVATPGVPLVQVPPGVASINNVVDATHTLSVPVIGSGNGDTVTTVVAIQPVINV